MGICGRAPRSAWQRQRGLGLCLGSQAIGLERQEGSLKLVSHMPFDLKRIWSGVGRARPPTLSLPEAVSGAGIPLPPALSSGRCSRPRPGLFQQQRVPEPAQSPGLASAQRAALEGSASI